MCDSLHIMIVLFAVFTADSAIPFALWFSGELVKWLMLYFWKKFLIFSDVKFGPLSDTNSHRYPYLAKFIFSFLDYSLCLLIFKLVYLPKVTEIIDSYQVVFILNLEQVDTDLFPWSLWKVVRH